MRHGSLLLELPDGRQLRYGSDSSPSAAMRLRNWNVFGAVLRSGDIGLAESYIAEDWSTPHLADLFRLLLANREALESLVYGSWWGRLAYRLRHVLSRNTKADSRQNIHAHYDLGNDFYQLWLDPSMNYSSAWFQGDLHGGLDAGPARQSAPCPAQCRRASLTQRVLEIGCGWGALAEMAADEFQAPCGGRNAVHRAAGLWPATAVSIGCATPGRFALAGLPRHPRRPFDAICSIEMIEAVGQAYWPTYFGAYAPFAQAGRAKPVFEAIVIDDTLFDRYVQGTDFIQQYIFPGGCLPSPSRIRAERAAAGLRVQQEFAFGPDYAETLRRWHQRFVQQRGQVLMQGFDTPLSAHLGVLLGVLRGGFQYAQY